MNANRINILGININITSKQEVFEKIAGFMSDDRQHYIVTPNPEIILKAIKDEEYFNIINQADLSVPDGIGLKFAAWTEFKNIIRITGADLSIELLEFCEKNNLKVCLVNWLAGLSNKTIIKAMLKNNFPRLKFLVVDHEREKTALVDVSEITNFSPKVLLVTLGNPYQEKFIFYNLKKLPSVKIGIGIGGAIDFLTQKAQRAPKVIRGLGFEWLWRVFKQPAGKKIWRLKRIFHAVFVFSYKFFLWRFVHPFLYRKNVACIAYKKTPEGTSILLVERADQPGHWQIPQGGTDGLSLKEAGMKELREELGNDKFTFIKSFPNLNQYEFPKGFARGRGAKYDKPYGYKGQKQGLLIAEFFGIDDDIKLNYWDHSDWKWIDADDAIDEVYPARKEAMVMFLEKFREAFTSIN
jgi:N-acetylglucosaminyldiphosphoundecaprenol N-acetyl-beta-D-mannosaminyltransferase